MRRRLYNRRGARLARPLCGKCAQQTEYDTFLWRWTNFVEGLRFIDCDAGLSMILARNRFQNNLFAHPPILRFGTRISRFSQYGNNAPRPRNNTRCDNEPWRRLYLLCICADTYGTISITRKSLEICNVQFVEVLYFLLDLLFCNLCKLLWNLCSKDAVIFALYWKEYQKDWVCNCEWCYYNNYYSINLKRYICL